MARLGGGDDARKSWAAGLDALGLGRAARERLLDAALADGTRGLAALDAATRHVGEMVGAGVLRRGREAEDAVTSLLSAGYEGALARISSARGACAQPAPTTTAPHCRRHGAVLRARDGRRRRRSAPSAEAAPRELAAAADDGPVLAWRARCSRPSRKRSGWLAPAALAATVLAAALVTLFGRARLPRARRRRADPDVVGDLGRLGARHRPRRRRGRALLEQRPARPPPGRHLEARLRVAFLEKIPRLGDRYFQSRPISDMAERGHSLHRARRPRPRRVLGAGAGLVATSAGVLWIDPAAAPILLPCAGVSLALPFLAHPAVAEHDLRRRTYVGALFRLTLDALLGLVAIRTHTAEDAIRREQEGLLADWQRAGLAAQRVAVRVEAAQALVGAALAVGLVATHLAREGPGGSSLLLVWWALEIPVFAQNLAVAARQYPLLRSTPPPARAARGPREDPPAGDPAATDGDALPAFVALRLDGVGVVVGGHAILEEITLDVPRRPRRDRRPLGRRQVEPHGLLGWHRPAAGRVPSTASTSPPPARARRAPRAHGVGGPGGPPLEPAPPRQRPLRRRPPRRPRGRRARRRQGDRRPPRRRGGPARRAPDPARRGRRLPLGRPGQRVRLARGQYRPAAGLVILDEALRGLDRDQRRDLLTLARERWRGATLLCVTHDAADTADFPRVVVLRRRSPSSRTAPSPSSPPRAAFTLRCSRPSRRRGRSSGGARCGGACGSTAARSPRRARRERGRRRDHAARGVGGGGRSRRRARGGASIAGAGELLRRGADHAAKRVGLELARVASTGARRRGCSVGGRFVAETADGRLLALLPARRGRAWALTPRGARGPLRCRRRRRATRCARPRWRRSPRTSRRSSTSSWRGARPGGSSCSTGGRAARPRGLGRARSADGLGRDAAPGGRLRRCSRSSPRWCWSQGVALAVAPARGRGARAGSIRGGSSRGLALATQVPLRAMALAAAGDAAPAAGPR
ncbi:MAG: hypothetical protein R3B82_24650 [Sandaracinaceae bacterium]